jgi:P-type Ca2+ transporter type 2C
MPLARDMPGIAGGISETEALRRLERDGANVLAQAGVRTPLRIVLEVLREPMLALLIGGGLVYLALGSVGDAAILLVFACLSVLITVVQETRTERVLEALRDLSSPRALVVREGVRRRIAGRDVVRGDVIVLSEGDRVPADALLIEARDLEADESLLTGESVPVRKHAGGAPAAGAPLSPGGAETPFVFSGALIVRGSGLAQVMATGPRSEIGKIGLSLAALEAPPARFQTETRRFVRLFAVIGAGISGLAILLYGLLRGGWLDAVLAGIALGMSMLPEEFPVVLAVFMAIGAWRISQVHVLTRRAAAIETLGSATVLCTDKTGTLTENRMTIAALQAATGAPVTIHPTEAGRLAAPLAEVLAQGVLASDPLPFDPMERAFHALAARSLGPADARPGPGWSLLRAYPLRSGLLALVHVWQTGDPGAPRVAAAKGAPEAIAALCRLDPAARVQLSAAVDAMAAAGFRVLGVARARADEGALPETPEAFAFTFLGLVGLADPLRSSVPAAVRECHRAGIRVVMITGDYPATARAIARQAGIAGEVMTGDVLAALPDAALASKIRGIRIFARIMPEQKLRIVEALKAEGEIVAMTGDGVNDAPSLKAAHIGIAMGGRGTDVAREAASIVLLDDDFGSIVRTVRLGRRIYDNLRKAMSFILAVHVPIAGLALLPLIFGLPILFGPVHIAFLEMVIDPVCSLVFEAETEEANVMARPPRDPATPLFSASMIGWSLFQGVFALVLVAGIFVIALDQGMPEDEVRALTFFSLVLTIVALIFVNRSTSASLVTAFRRPNRALFIVLPVVGLMLGISLFWPAARAQFRFGPLHLDDLALTLASGLSVLVVLELLKPLWRRRFSGRGAREGMRALRHAA